MLIACYSGQILKETKDNAVDLMVSDDGSWETLNEEGKLNKLSSATKEELMAQNSIESSVEDGEIHMQKNDTSYIELSDNDEPERRNCIDGFTVGEGYANCGGEMEDRKPDVRELNAALATTTGSGQVSIAESATILPHGSSNQCIPQTMQLLSNEVFTLPEAQVERQGNQEVSRSPIAIQALPAQMANANPNYRTRPRTNSPHPNPSVQVNNSQSGINQRPLQVQLPSFVGIQDGQVLLTTPHFQQETDEFLNANQLQQVNNQSVTRSI